MTKCERKENVQNEDPMWERACFLTRLVACSVRVSETAGRIIKDIMRRGDLKIVDKGNGSKEDLQTEADRSAQYCIVKSLQEKFGSKLTVIGEEERVSVAPYLELNYSAEVLKIDDNCPKELRQVNVDDVVVWVDPLDGTSEFAQAARDGSPLLQQVTVLIGISYKGRSVAGVIHQPYWGENQIGRTIWAIVGAGAYGIDIVREKSERVVVTTRSHSSTTVAEALQALKKCGLADSVQPVGGAGYKVIKCLEGAAAYVFASPGCKKWDTAAPEAVIVAAGGKLTDVAGRQLYYGADAQIGNSGGVLATSSWVNHKDYVDNIPEFVKAALPEFISKR
uniref:3'(2'),5'-bisphosphate nucleotidase 1 n=1 Tax=Ascaris suum TaxID=6253 RepID=F1KW65_ASCSU